MRGFVSKVCTATRLQLFCNKFCQQAVVLVAMAILLHQFRENHLFQLWPVRASNRLSFSSNQFVLSLLCFVRVWVTTSAGSEAAATLRRPGGKRTAATFFILMLFESNPC